VRGAISWLATVTSKSPALLTSFNNNAIKVHKSLKLGTYNYKECQSYVQSSRLDFTTDHDTTWVLASF
jgi:hypothetical protein